MIVKTGNRGSGRSTRDREEVLKALRTTKDKPQEFAFCFSNSGLVDDCIREMIDANKSEFTQLNKYYYRHTRTSNTITFCYGNAKNANPTTSHLKRYDKIFTDHWFVEEKLIEMLKSYDREDWLFNED